MLQYNKKMLRYLLIIILYYQYYSEYIPINEIVLIIPKNETDIHVKSTYIQSLYFDYI
jgi:hypothetical protein